MDLPEACLLVVTLAVVSCDVNAVNIQAEINTEYDKSNEFLQMIIKQLEMMGDRDSEINKTLSQSHTDLAAALLQVAPVVTIRGNITDPGRRLALSFTLTASALDTHSGSGADWDAEWGGAGGVLTPIVATVEPYVLSFAELVLSGLLSTIIGNFLEAASLGHLT